MDAPLTRYLLGIGGTIAGLPALALDWDWSQSWEANQAAGALPGTDLLVVGRLAVTLLLPFNLLLTYAIGKQIHGELTGCLAVLLMGANALLLLHNRRAMAEAALTFGVLFALWSFLEGNRRPWLAGLGLALAFNAKQSGLALMPVGLLAVIYLPAPVLSVKRLAWVRLPWAWAQYLGVFLLVTLALNPFLWRQPFKAAQAAWKERQELQARQVADNARLSPEVALLTPSNRAAALLAHLYMAPLTFSETANYQAQTAAAEKAYLAFPGHNLLRGLAAGSILFALTLFGFPAGAFTLTARLGRTTTSFGLAAAGQRVPGRRIVLFGAPALAALCDSTGTTRLPVDGVCLERHTLCSASSQGEQATNTENTWITFPTALPYGR